MLTFLSLSLLLLFADGEVAEFASPASLLRNPSSAFSKMVADTGAANAQLLQSLAFAAEKGMKIDASMLAEGAALAPDAVAAGLSSPSLLVRPSQRGGEGDALSLLFDLADPEASQLRWHEAKEGEEDTWMEEPGLIAEAEPLKNAIRSSIAH